MRMVMVSSSHTFSTAHVPHTLSNKVFFLWTFSCAAWLLPSSAFITQQWKQPFACVMKHFRSEHLNHYLQLVIKGFLLRHQWYNGVLECSLRTQGSMESRQFRLKKTELPQFQSESDGGIFRVTSNFRLNSFRGVSHAD